MLFKISLKPLVFKCLHCSLCFKPLAFINSKGKVDASSQFAKH